MSRRRAKTNASRTSFSPGGHLEPGSHRSGRPDRAAPFSDAPHFAGDSQILGERLRRYALALTASLLTVRAYWTSEPDIRNGAGGGLTWILLLLFAAGLAILSAIVSGRVRIRRSWTDLGVIVLVLLVALSSTHAVDRRPAINLAWEWLGFGIAYLLLRNLPARREESVAIAGMMVATAVAVSIYGLYQAKFELPALREAFLRNPAQMMEQAGVVPGTAGELSFRNRLLGSDEIWSTFGLANSCAGFLIGPLVVSLGVILVSLAQRDGIRPRWGAFAKALIPTLVILLCLVLTKSRSAWLGLIVGMLILAWHVRRLISRRVFLATSIAATVIIVIFAGIGISSGRIDREVLTQSPMSLRYRLEYWQATWGVITDGATSFGRIFSSPTFWIGLGPGNFGPAYLLHKLPQASEEIQDPHNFILEVWSISGIWALIALIAVVALGLRILLGVSPTDSEVTREPDTDANVPSAVRWVIGGSAAAWAVVVVMGELNPFVGDLFSRWLLLGFGWLAAVLLGASLWRSTPLPAWVLGAGVMAMLVNLLAAGGIGIPTVALCLWTLLAVGQNLRDDQPCSELLAAGARTTAVSALGVWTAAFGVFLGAIVPYWNSEAAIASADAALENTIRPNYQGAEAALQKAITYDQYSSRPWRKLAGLEMRAWQERGAKPEDLRWKTIPISLLKAVTPPRNPNVWGLHAERAAVMTNVLKIVGPSLKEIERIQYLGNIVEATRNASRLYPTNPALHANLAIASGEISMFRDAVSEANEALRLDSILLEANHLDKRLPDALRKQLQSKIEDWKKREKEMPVDIPR